MKLYQLEVGKFVVYHFVKVWHTTLHMKKYTLLLTQLLLVSACSTPQNIVDPLPADQVMKKAAQASMLFESADYSIQSSFVASGGVATRTTGEVNLQGSLHNSGEHLQSNVTLQATMEEAEETTSLAIDTDLIVLGPQDIYVHVRSFTSDGPKVLLPPIFIEAIQDQWLQVGQQDIQNTAVTPDARLLYAQVNVMDITKELPPALLDNRMHYHYNVAVDPEKLISYILQVSKEQQQEVDEAEIRKTYEDISATGSLWIDAETFHVRKVVWNIEPFTTSAGTTLELHVTAEFTNFNAAQPILAPESFIKPQELFSLFVAPSIY